MKVETLIGAVTINEQVGIARGTLTSRQVLTGQLASTHAAHLETYSGPYEVTPQIVSQTLDTKEKYMDDNVSIKSIPYFDVGNTSGGSTVYIGTEIEFE